MGLSATPFQPRLGEKMEARGQIENALSDVAKSFFSKVKKGAKNWRNRKIRASGEIEKRALKKTFVQQF